MYKVPLNDGVRMPVIGYGTAFPRLFNRGDVEQITEDDYQTIKGYLKSAIEAGFVHLDTAEVYLSESIIGRALKELNVDRNSIFITTKISVTWFGVDRNRSCVELTPNLSATESTIQSVTNSLRYLQTSFIDLVLIHKPHTKTGDGMDVIECYKTLLGLKAKGKIRSVGVSNFNVSHLRTMIETFRLPPPSVNQLELHPFAARSEIVNYCNKYNIRVSPFSPLCRGGRKGLFRGLKQEISCYQHPIIRSLCDKYSKTPPQILLRWSVQNGFVPITNTTKRQRMVNNIKIFDFELTKNDMDLMALLNENVEFLDWRLLNIPHPLFEKWNYKVSPSKL
eukprot:172204_1